MRALVLLLLFSTSAWAQAPVAAPQEKEARVFGQKMAYLEAGSGGPVVVLLHGLGASSAHWRLTIPALAASFKVYAPDHLGSGKSDKPALNYRIGTLVDMLDEFFAQTGITKATLVGNSMGGWIAAAYAARHPEKVDRLVLVDAAGYSQKRWGGPPVNRDDLLRLNPSTLDGMRELLLTLFANKQLVNDVTVKAAFAQKLAASDGAVVNALIDSIVRNEDFLDGTLGAIKAPTLLLWGAGDALVPLAVARAFEQDIAGSKLKVLENCGHVPMLECFAPFNAALSEFLTAR